MVIITSINADSFEINEVRYPTIYQPIVGGVNDLAIAKVYDTRHFILNQTDYREIELDGVTYGSRDALVDALLPVIYKPVGTSASVNWGSVFGLLSNQTDLQSALDAKAASSHTHLTSDITNLSVYTGFDARYFTETEADARFAPISHSHTVSDISNLGDYTGFDTRYEQFPFSMEVSGRVKQTPFFIENFETGWADWYGNGTVSIDTTDYVEGTGSVKIVSDSGLGIAGMRKNITDTDMSGSSFRVWVKSDDWANVTEASILISTSGTFTAFYQYNVMNQLINLPNDEWLEVVFTERDLVVGAGSPDLSTANDLIVRVYSSDGNTPTVWWDGFQVTSNINTALVSVTFDDNWDSDLTEGKEYMDTYGFRGTSFVIPDEIGIVNKLTQSQIESMNAQGWEIGAHGGTNLTTFSAVDLITELKGIKEYFNTYNYKGSNHFAYPNGGYNEQVMKYTQRYFGTARTIDGGGQPLNNVVPMKVAAKTISNTTTPATIQGWVDDAIANNEWLVLCFHKIVASGASLSTEYNRADFQTVIDYLNTSGVNVLPYGEAYEYVRSLNNETLGDFLTDAPSDGNEYVRLNGAWAVNSGGAGGGDAATLDGLDSTSFLRSDAADVKTAGNLRMNDGISIEFGNDTDAAMSYNAGLNDMFIDLKTVDDLRFLNNGSSIASLERTTGDFRLLTGNLDLSNGDGVVITAVTGLGNANDIVSTIPNSAYGAVIHSTGSTNYPEEFGQAFVFRGNDSDGNRDIVLWKANGDNSRVYLGSWQNGSSSWTWSEVWHSNSDGSGSGLDADTLDGIEGANFLRSDTSDTMSGNLTLTGNLISGSSVSSSYTQVGVMRKDVSTADYGEAYFAVDGNNQSAFLTNQVNDSTAANGIHTINYGGSTSIDPRYGVYNGSSYDYYDFITEKTSEANFNNFPSVSNVSFNFDNAAIANQGATFRYEYSDGNMLTGTGFGFQILGHNGSSAPRLEVEGAIYSGAAITAVGRLSSAGLDIVDSGTAIDVQTAAGQWALRTDTNGANFTGVFFNSSGDGLILGRTNAGNIGVDLRPFSTSKLYGNVLEIHGASPRVRFLEKASATESDVFGSSTADWNVVLDAGNFDVRSNNVTNTRLRIESTGAVRTYNGTFTVNGNQVFVMGSTSNASNNYAHITRNSAASVLYVNNRNSSGDFARFYVGGSNTATSGSNQITLAANGEITAVDFINSSDLRLKENIEDLEVQPIKVDWKTYNLKDSSDRKRYGVIAQELEEHHPEFVVTDHKTGMKSVSYIDLLVAKMAEKDEQIESLEARVEKLEGLIANLIPSLN